jgi:hypothetical protein
MALLTYFMVILLKPVTIFYYLLFVLTKYVYCRLCQNYGKKRIRTRWVRTRTGRCIHWYGGTLRARCLQRLRNTKLLASRAETVGTTGTCLSNVRGKLRNLCQHYVRLATYAFTRVSTRCIALHASTVSNLRASDHRYDTDSRTLIIDNGCSASITNDLTDFIFPPFKVKASIQGYSGSTNATHLLENRGRSRCST